MSLSLNQTLLILLFYVRKTWKTQFILAISLRGLSSFILRDSTTDMNGPAAYVKEGFPLACVLSLEKSEDSYS